jgi:hypothetical protein
MRDHIATLFNPHLADLDGFDVGKTAMALQLAVTQYVVGVIMTKDEGDKLVNEHTGDVLPKLEDLMARRLHAVRSNMDADEFDGMMRAFVPAVNSSGVYQMLQAIGAKAPKIGSLSVRWARVFCGALALDMLRIVKGTDIVFARCLAYATRADSDGYPQPPPQPH